MIYKIPNAFDSHCHFLATGQVALGLDLKNLKSAQDIKNLKIEAHHYQSNWIVGFGWDQNKWPLAEFPNSLQLDEYFSQNPVFFSRADGHASWINSKGLQELKKNGFNFSNDPMGGKIQRNPEGLPTGILFDQAHILALKMLPTFSESQNRTFLKKSQILFNQGGFTHVRDLSMNLPTWMLLESMVEKKELTVCIEGFVTIENLSELPQVLNQVQQMKNRSNPYLRIQGVKLFLDGSIGSKTAYISQNYLNESSLGILCWDLNDVKVVMKTCWQKGFDFAVHTIGDQSVHHVLLLARALSAEGAVGRLHLEHVQIIRPETIQLMKPLHITCHMQPCHWLSDSPWLKNVIPESLLKNSFPWEALRKNKIQLQFGSDAPIETSSLLRNHLALKQSAEQGWPEFQADWKSYHSHPDKSWTRSFTEFTDERIVQVVFNGEPLL